MPLALSGLVAVLLSPSGTSAALATAAGLFVGAAAYAAVFTWAGLATRHAIVIGLVYVFVWEASLAAYLDGVRLPQPAPLHARARRRARRRPPRGANGLLGARTAALLTAGVVVAFFALATRRLGRMDIP